MTAHTCKTLTDGCYRCDLNRDEIEAIRAEDAADAKAAWIEYRDWKFDEAVPVWREDDREAITGAVRRTLRKREFIAGFMAGRQA